METRNITSVNQSTTGILSDGLPVAASSQQPFTASSTPSTTINPASPASGTTDAVAINWSTPLFHKLYEGKTALNSAADTVRQANSALNSAGQIIGNMKLQLDGIVKNYPPFPPGDTERMKYLEGFMSLRQQIEQLTFPHDNSKLAVTIPALPTNPVNDTSDAPIHDAIAALGSAAGTINAQQQRLSSGFQAILATQAGVGASAQSTAAVTTLAEYSAAQNSRSIQTALTTTSSGLSSSENSFLRKL